MAGDENNDLIRITPRKAFRVMVERGRSAAAQSHHHGLKDRDPKDRAGDAENIHLPVSVPTLENIAEFQNKVAELVALLKKEMTVVDIQKKLGIKHDPLMTEDDVYVCMAVEMLTIPSDHPERNAKLMEIAPAAAMVRAYVESARTCSCGGTSCSGGCNLNRAIGTVNRLMAQGKFEEAFMEMFGGNPDVKIPSNSSEFGIGHVCTAGCKAGCTWGAGKADAVEIPSHEHILAEFGWKLGWFKHVFRVPQNVEWKEQKVAVIGSGPAGLQVAVTLRKLGYDVTVFERDERPGGLMEYGIPPWKNPRETMDEYIRLMKDMGIEFRTSTKVGKDGDITMEQIQQEFDAAVLAVGVTDTPRKIGIPNEDKWVTQAIEVLHDASDAYREMGTSGKNLKGKTAFVIGDGDTAADVIAKAVRDMYDKATGKFDGRIVHIHHGEKIPPQRQYPQQPVSAKLSYAMAEWKAVDPNATTHYGCKPDEFLFDKEEKLIGLETMRRSIDPAHLYLAKQDQAGLYTVHKEEKTRFDNSGDGREVVIIGATGFAGAQGNKLVQDLGLTRKDGKNDLKSLIHVNSPRFATDRKRTHRLEAFSEGNQPIAGIHVAGDAAEGQLDLVTALMSGKHAAFSVHSWLEACKNEGLVKQAAFKAVELWRRTQEYVVSRADALLTVRAQKAKAMYVTAHGPI